ncbi:MAG: SH3 domain-containing protein [Anaerolineae bacterium]
MRTINVMRPFLLLTALLFLAACGAGRGEPTQLPLVIPTAIVTSETTAVQATPTTKLPAPPTIQPTAELTNQPTPSPTAPPTASAPAASQQYQVAFVTADDTLNVRSGPGVANSIVGELAPHATGVQITGLGQVVAGSTWVPINASGLTGWVNSRYLAQSVPDFCDEAAVTQLLGDLKTAVSNQDGDLLAQLVHPERGLRIHHSWWNPEVQLTQADVRHIFASNIQINWGTQAGSGNPIIGSFSQEILPLLQNDLLMADESACDEILHGGTAGIVRLPDGYEAVHYYSLYRPGTDEFAGMNWGTWVVGVEQWQGSWYVSYLVHFQWEI